MTQGEQEVASLGPVPNSPQLTVLSSMNEQLARENAALIAELAKLQCKQRSQVADQGRQRHGPSLVAGIPSDQLESLFSYPGTASAAAAAAPSSSSTAAANAAASALSDDSSAQANASSIDVTAKESDDSMLTAPEHCDTPHAALYHRAQHLETQMELIHVKAECEGLRAEAAEAAGCAETRQGITNMLRRQLNAAHTQHEKETRDLRKAAKLIERRAEELAQQLPKAAVDPSLQVGQVINNGVYAFCCPQT